MHKRCIEGGTRHDVWLRDLHDVGGIPRRCPRRVRPQTSNADEQHQHPSAEEFWRDPRHFCSHALCAMPCMRLDRKSTRLNSSHVAISYAVFCLKKKKKQTEPRAMQRTHGGAGEPDPGGKTSGG